ncbi:MULTISPECIES: GAF domain-containing protein [unclassified Methanosarcina]|uniref:sensor histidine kinase n=1 Tax=unclassified Methanosarcina TaxID=2644672 RepID=UPI000615C5B5|nr:MULTISPECIES: GAF domain-containing protein [unclassified Methanosarcina]AKB19346.1 sensory transduction histidine kinase [Methanosarcina sp. WWM596]AKB22826.1 sensory transduction histidine kinase [Methanosarcina sp. WH1]
MRYIDDRTLIKRNEKGEIVHYQGIALDITERKLAEEMIKGQNLVLGQLASGAPLEEVLLLLIKNMEKIKPGSICSVMLLDREKKHLFYCVAPGLPWFYRQKTTGVEIGFGAASFGTAAFLRKRVTVDNIMEHPYWTEYRELAAEAGLKACWSEPVISSSGEVLGVISMYYGEVHRPEKEDLDFMKTNAQLAAIAVEHKLAEETLWESEHKFRTIFNNINDQLYIREPEGKNYMDVNQAVVNRLGYDKEEILKMEAEEIIPAEYWDSVRENLIKIQSEGSRVYNSGAVCEDGTIVPLEVSARIIDYDGKKTILSVARDITERKKAEAAQKLNESRLEALVKLNRMTGASLKEITDFAREEAVRLTDSKLGYLAFMDAYETSLIMHSWSKSAMEECTIEDKPFIYPIKTTGLWGEAIRQRKPIITNDYPAPSSLKKGYPKDHVHLTRHMNVPVFDGDRIVAVAGVGNKDEPYDESDLRQVTLLTQGMWQLIQRKQLEDALKTYSEDMSKVNDELRSLNRIKAEFMAESLPQIKVNYSDLMDFETLETIEDQQRKAIDAVINSSERLKQMVDSLLYLSLEQAGKIEYSFAKVEIKKILSDVYLNLVLLIDEKELKVEKELPANLPPIPGDKQKLTDLFTTLMSNAIKFTPQGGTLEVTAIEEKKNIHITVKDGGTGIHKRLIPHLFHRIYQVEDSMTRRYQGLESGFYICKNIVNAHEGEIWVESEEGSGTTVHVRLPKKNVKTGNVN